MARASQDLGSEAMKTDRSTEKVARKKRTRKKKKSRILSKERVRHSRPPDLTNDTTQCTGRVEKLARKRHDDKVGDAARDETEKNDAAADQERKKIKRRRRRRIEALKSVTENIDRIVDGIIPKLQFKDALGPKSGEIHRKIGSSSRTAVSFETSHSQTARSVTRSAATVTRVAHGGFGARGHGKLAVPVAKSHSNITFSSQKSIQKAKGTGSDNGSLLKRTRGSDDLTRNEGTSSDLGSRNVQRAHGGRVTAGSYTEARFQVQSPSAVQKISPPTKKRAGAELVKPVPRKESRNQDGQLPATKRLRSLPHHSDSKPPERLLRPSQQASNSQGSGESLRNDGSKKTGSSSKADRLATNLSKRLGHHTKRTVGGRRQSPPNGWKTKGPPEKARASDGAIMTDVTKEKPQVKIPADTKMATNLRAYSQWPDDSGALMYAHGCLLPAKYGFSGIQGFDWICPIRSCRTCFKSQKQLGFHFIVRLTVHHSCLLNDNCDGTFTILGKYEHVENGDDRQALVESKNPLPPNEPPMIQPRPSRIGFSPERKSQWIMASQNKMRSMTAPDSGELSTVDEMMLHRGFLSTAETSVSSELGEPSRTPSDQTAQQRVSKPHVSLPSGLNPPDDPGSDNNSARSLELDESNNQGDMPNTARDATKENWRLIRKFLGGRKFHPPKRGHFAALLSTPRTRDIILRPGRRFVADQPKKVRLLIVHMTGDESPAPCNSCSMDRGPFKKCVAINKAAAGETANGTVCCTNCASKKGLPQKCDVEDLLNRPAAEAKRMRRKASPTPKSRENPSPGETSLGVTSLDATAPRVTKVDSHFTLRLHSLPMDGSLGLDADPLSLRLCSVAAGKVMVEMEGNMPFLIGTHGMFKLSPEVSAHVSNASEEEAVLHVSALKV